MTLVVLINTHHLFISFYTCDRLVNMCRLTTGSLGLIILLSWMKEIGPKDYKGVDAQVISLHLTIPRMTKWRYWRCVIRSGYYGKTVKGKRCSVAMDHAAVKGKQGGLAPKNQIRWWRASDGFVMMDRARPFEATSNRINHLKNIWWNGIGIGVPQDNERKMKKGIPNGIVLFLFTFEFRNAVLLRGMQRRGVCVCLGAQSDLS